MSSGICLWITLKFHQIWVAGLIWSEIKQLWDVGLKEYVTNIFDTFFFLHLTFLLHFLTSRYVSDMWNVVDFITNSLYVATIGLRLRAYYDVSSFFWVNLSFVMHYNHIYARPSSSWQEQREK